MLEESYSTTSGWARRLFDIHAIPFQSLNPSFEILGVFLQSPLRNGLLTRQDKQIVDDSSLLLQLGSILFEIFGY